MIETAFRETTRGHTVSITSLLPEDLRGEPIRCRLTRIAEENRFIGEWWNPLGEQWEIIADPIIEMTDEVLLGLASTSHIDDDKSLAKGFIRNLEITELPSLIPDWRFR